MWKFAYILHVLWFISWGVPAVVEDEDVGLRQTFIYFVKKMLFLQESEVMNERW